MNPFGYVSPAQSAQAIKASSAGFRAGRIQSRDGRNIDPRTITVADAIDALRCVRAAARVPRPRRRVRASADDGQGGLLDHDETVANLTLFSREVLPSLGSKNSARDTDAVLSGGWLRSAKLGQTSARSNT